jgi:hypothetical protein
MLCHLGLQAATAEIPSYMIDQSYWKMYHLQSEHECGTCMMVLQHILAVLCKMFSITLAMGDGQVEQETMHGLHTRQI